MSEPTIFIESVPDGHVVDPDAPPTLSRQPGGHGENVVTLFSDKVIGLMREAVDRVKSGMKDAAAGVDQFELSFSLELYGENGMIIKGGGRGGIGVKLIWGPKPTG